VKMKYENLVHHELLNHLDENEFEVSECLAINNVALNPYSQLDFFVGVSSHPNPTFSEVVKEIHKDHLPVEVYGGSNSWTILKYNVIVMTHTDREIVFEAQLTSNISLEEAKARVQAKHDKDVLEKIVGECLNNSKKQGTL